MFIAKFESIFVVVCDAEVFLNTQKNKVRKFRIDPVHVRTKRTKTKNKKDDELKSTVINLHSKMSAIFSGSNFNAWVDYNG